MKRFIPIGMVVRNTADLLKMMRADDFSDDKYEGVQLRSGKYDDIVMIMHSNKPSPRPWRVSYGFSTVFFNTLEEAVAFCEEHGMKLINKK